MALEAVVFAQDWFTRTRKRPHPMAGEQWIYELGDLEGAGNALLVTSESEAGTGGLGSCHGSAATMHEPSWTALDGMRGRLWDPSSSMAQSFLQDYDNMATSSPEVPATDGVASPDTAPAVMTAARCRRKRRRARSCKNEAEVENQRMTHIAVERNRRKQMNEYLAALRSLMPAYYVQRVRCFSLPTSSPPRIPPSSFDHLKTRVIARLAGRPGVHRRGGHQLREGAGAVSGVPGGPEADEATAAAARRIRHRWVHRPRRRWGP